MPVICPGSTSGFAVKLVELSPVLEGALTTKGGHYEKACSYKEQLQTYMGKCSCNTCDFLQRMVKAPTIVQAFAILILSCQFKMLSLVDNWETNATEANILMHKPPHLGKKNNSKARATEHAVMLEAIMGQHVTKKMKITANVNTDGAQTSNMHIICKCANWIALFEHDWVIPTQTAEQPLLFYAFHEFANFISSTNFMNYYDKHAI
eukprot:15366129-Ditylum_brightwellii.AAC.2